MQGAALPSTGRARHRRRRAAGRPGERRASPERHLLDAAGGPEPAWQAADWRLLNNRRDRIAIALLAGIPALLLSLPALAGYPLATGDAVVQNLPLRALAGEILAHGHLPLYNSFVSSGAPLLGGINAGAAFPDVALFAVLPPIAAFVVVEILAYAGAAVGLYALLRCQQLHPLSSALGAAGYGLAGFLSSQAVHIGVVETGAALAWVLVALDRLARGPRRHAPFYGVLLAGATACCGLAGSPTGAFFAAVGAVIFGAHVLLGAGGRWRVALLWDIAGVASGAALAGVQVLPGASFVGVSQRASVPPSSITSGALGLRQLFELVAPHLLGGGPIGLVAYVGSYNLGEIDAYAGILALVAAGALLPTLLQRRASAYRVWYLVGLVGLVIALGRATPMPDLLVHLPIVDASRLPSRALLLYALGSSILVAFCVEQLLEKPPGWSRWSSIGGAIGPVGAIGLVAATLAGGTPVATFLAYRLTKGWSPASIAPWAVLQIMIDIGALVLVIGHRRFTPRGRTALLCVVAITDLVLFSADQSSFAPLPSAALHAPNRYERELHAKVGTGRFLVYDPRILGGIVLDEIGVPDMSSLYSLESAQGYGSLVWDPYQRATKTHGQDVLSPASLGSGVYDHLDVTTLLATAGAFRSRSERAGSGAPASSLWRIGPGEKVTRYFGGSVLVRSISIVVRSETSGRDLGGRALTGALVAGVHLLAQSNGQVLRGSMVQATVSGSEVTLGFEDLPSAGGIEISGSLELSGVLVGDVVVTPAHEAPFGLDGTLSPVVSAPRWRLDGMVGRFSAFANPEAAGPFFTSAIPRASSPRASSPGASSPGTSSPRASSPRASSPGASSPGASSPRASHARPHVSLVSFSPWTGAAVVRTGSTAPFRLVRSVADIPGWSAQLVRLGPAGSPEGPRRNLPVERDGLEPSVIVPAGQFLVELTYTAPGLGPGLALAAMGLGATLSMASVGLLAALRRRSAPRLRVRQTR